MPDFSDSVMIALTPSVADATQLAVEGGLPQEELHVTLSYLGLLDDIAPNDLRYAAHVAEEVASLFDNAIEADVAGRAVLGDDYANVLLMNGPSLATAQKIVWRYLDHEFDDGPYRKQYKPWIPHMTLGYGIEIPEFVLQKVTFDHVTFSVGDEEMKFPLYGVQKFWDNKLLYA